MGVILDTSILISYERGSIALDELIKGREREPFGISVITVSELLHGVHRANTKARRLKREAFVQKVVDSLPIYEFNVASARIYAEIWAFLLKKGVQVGAHDLMIASTAISLGFSVATHNLRDFRKIEGLTMQVL